MIFNQSKRKEKILNKAVQNSLLRKSIYYRKNLCINNYETQTKIIRIKTLDDKYNFLFPKMSQDYRVVFMLPNTKKIDTFFFKKEVDIVFCDINWRIISLHEKQPINVLIPSEEKTRHIWIMSKGMIYFLGLKIDDILSTKVL